MKGGGRMRAIITIEIPEVSLREMGEITSRVYEHFTFNQVEINLQWGKEEQGEQTRTGTKKEPAYHSINVKV